MNSTPDILQFLGRLHTLILHLPIGILVFAFILELATIFNAYEKLKPAIPFVLFWGMISAIVTAIFGFILSREGGYDADAIWNHKYLGITTAVFATGLYFFKNRKNVYLILLSGTAILLGLTGHSGGSITHGSEFLFEPFKEKKAAEVSAENINDIKIYAQLIQPIFKSKCNSCHNSGKVKGGLILTDTLSIKKGGDSGALFNMDNIGKSLLLQRIHLPMDIDEHMPPKGKKQLSDWETKLLRWWISGKATFTKTVGDYPADPEIEAFLTNKYTRKKSGIETIDIEPATASQISNIQKQGLKVYPLGNDSPWLEARLSDRKTLTQANFKSLEKLAKNITILDLGNTPLDDQLFQNINSFPNLSKLFLDQTSITDEGFKKINSLKYLEYLNLYACDISDKSILYLKQFKNLKSLFLWQTKISDQGITELKNTFPDLKVINGKEKSKVFAEAKLRSPKIKADSLMFRQQMAVTLDLNFPWAKLYYTLDGTEPDSSSLLYEDSILISNSTTIKTLAIAEGWTNSDVAEETFIAVKNQIPSIKISQAPDPAYKAQGANTLIDFQLGSSNFKDGKWLGWQGKNLTATLDFKTPTAVSSIFISCLDNNSSWIFFPKGLKVWASDDGHNFTEILAQRFSLPIEQAPASIRKIKSDFLPVKTRFLKVHVENLGKNPDWHPAPGKPSWLFVDEIIIE